ncbi:unnamed protein product [Caenorhabditis brenneri]
MHLTSDEYQTAAQKMLAENQSDHSKAKEPASMNTEITKNKQHKSLEAPTTIRKVQQNESKFKRSNTALLNAQLIAAKRRWKQAKTESNPFQVSRPAPIEDVDPELEIDDDELPTFCRRLKNFRKNCVYISKDCMRYRPKATGVRNVKLEKPVSPKENFQFIF